jgi:hypothetical protein
MYSTQLSPGSASIASVLAKIERIFRQEESYGSHPLFITKTPSDLSINANFIKENKAVLEQMLNVAPMQPPNPKKLKINALTWKRFINILNRVVKAQDGVSRQELLFVQQFWSELNSISEGNRRL